MAYRSTQNNKSHVNEKTPLTQETNARAELWIFIFYLFYMFYGLMPEIN